MAVPKSPPQPPAGNPAVDFLRTLTPPTPAERTRAFAALLQTLTAQGSSQ